MGGACEAGCLQARPAPSSRRSRQSEAQVECVPKRACAPASPLAWAAVAVAHCQQASRHKRNLQHQRQVRGPVQAHPPLPPHTHASACTGDAGPAPCPEPGRTRGARAAVEPGGDGDGGVAVQRVQVAHRLPRVLQARALGRTRAREGWGEGGMCGTALLCVWGGRHCPSGGGSATQ